MFALVAAICLLLALLRVVAPFDLVTLGLLLMAVQLAFGWPTVWPWRRTP